MSPNQMINNPDVQKSLLKQYLASGQQMRRDKPSFLQRLFSIVGFDEWADDVAKDIRTWTDDTGKVRPGRMATSGVRIPFNYVTDALKHLGGGFTGNRDWVDPDEARGKEMFREFAAFAANAKKRAPGEKLTSDDWERVKELDPVLRTKVGGKVADISTGAFGFAADVLTPGVAAGGVKGVANVAAGAGRAALKGAVKKAGVESVEALGKKAAREAAQEAVLKTGWKGSKASLAKEADQVLANVDHLKTLAEQSKKKGFYIGTPFTMKKNKLLKEGENWDHLARYIENPLFAGTRDLFGLAGKVPVGNTNLADITRGAHNTLTKPFRPGAAYKESVGPDGAPSKLYEAMTDQHSRLKAAGSQGEEAHNIAVRSIRTLLDEGVMTVEELEKVPGIKEFMTGSTGYSTFGDLLNMLTESGMKLTKGQIKKISNLKLAVDTPIPPKKGPGFDIEELLRTQGQAPKGAKLPIGEVGTGVHEGAHMKIPRPEPKLKPKQGLFGAEKDIQGVMELTGNRKLEPEKYKVKKIYKDGKYVGEKVVLDEGPSIEKATSTGWSVAFSEANKINLGATSNEQFALIKEYRGIIEPKIARLLQNQGYKQDEIAEVIERIFLGKKKTAPTDPEKIKALKATGPNTVSVVGSRGIKNKDLIYEKLDEIHKSHPITKIVSGGAEGPDSIAAQWAKDRGVKLEEILPDWKGKGMSAGLIRNTDIVNKGDQVVAFWDGKSRGTRDSINKAKGGKKRLTVVKTKGAKTKKPTQNAKLKMVPAGRGVDFSDDLGLSEEQIISRFRKVMKGEVKDIDISDIDFRLAKIPDKEILKRYRAGKDAHFYIESDKEILERFRAGKTAGLSDEVQDFLRAKDAEGITGLDGVKKSPYLDELAEDGRLLDTASQGKFGSSGEPPAYKIDPFFEMEQRLIKEMDKKRGYSGKEAYKKAKKELTAVKKELTQEEIQKEFFEKYPRMKGKTLKEAEEFFDEGIEAAKKARKRAEQASEELDLVLREPRERLAELKTQKANYEKSLKKLKGSPKALEPLKKKLESINKDIRQTDSYIKEIGAEPAKELKRIEAISKHNIRGIKMARRALDETTNVKPKVDKGALNRLSKKGSSTSPIIKAMNNTEGITVESLRAKGPTLPNSGLTVAQDEAAEQMARNYVSFTKAKITSTDLKLAASVLKRAGLPDGIVKKMVAAMRTYGETAKDQEKALKGLLEKFDTYVGPAADKKAIREAIDNLQGFYGKNWTDPAVRKDAFDSIATIRGRLNDSLKYSEENAKILQALDRVIFEPMERQLMRMNSLNRGGIVKDLHNVGPAYTGRMYNELEHAMDPAGANLLAKGSKTFKNEALLKSYNAVTDRPLTLKNSVEDMASMYVGKGATQEAVREAFEQNFKELIDLAVKKKLGHKVGVYKSAKDVPSGFVPTGIKELDEANIYVSRDVAVEMKSLVKHHSPAERSELGRIFSATNNIWKMLQTGGGVNMPMVPVKKLRGVLNKWGLPEGATDSILSIVELYNEHGAFARIAPAFTNRNMATNLMAISLGGEIGPVQALKYYARGLKGMARLRKLSGETANLGMGKAWVINKTVKDSDKLMDAILKDFRASGLLEASYLKNEGFTEKGLGAIVDALSGSRAMTHNEAMELGSKLGLFIHLREGGYSVQAAARKVNKVLFDYGDSTAFERDFIKPYTVFYTWTKKNVELMVDAFANDPKWFIPFAKSIKSLAHTLSDNTMSQEEKDAFPEYLDKYASAKFKDKDGNLSSLMGLGTNIEAFAEFLGNDPKDFLHNVGSMLAPTVKAPLELIMDYNFFKEKPISEDTSAYMYRGMPEGAKRAMGIRESRYTDKQGNDRVTYMMNPTTKYLLENTIGRPVGVVAKQAAILKGEQPAGRGTLDLMTGAKYNTFDTNYLLYQHQRKEYEESMKLLEQLGIVKSMPNRYYFNPSAKDLYPDIEGVLRQLEDNL